MAEHRRPRPQAEPVERLDRSLERGGETSPGVGDGVELCVETGPACFAQELTRREWDIVGRAVQGGRDSGPVRDRERR
ncbi:MAG TPA: hypothetical protein VGI27_11445, partial [Solirubrobacteraceae bacterium]